MESSLVEVDGGVALVDRTVPALNGISFFVTCLHAECVDQSYLFLELFDVICMFGDVARVLGDVVGRKLPKDLVSRVLCHTVPRQQSDRLFTTLSPDTAHSSMPSHSPIFTLNPQLPRHLPHMLKRPLMAFKSQLRSLPPMLLLNLKESSIKI